MSSHSNGTCTCDLSGFKPTAQTPKGSRFLPSWAGSPNVRVTRASRRLGWVDVVVANGAWTKRMPHGIPVDWSEVTS